MPRPLVIAFAFLCTAAFSDAKAQRPEIPLGAVRLDTVSSYVTRVARADDHLVALWQSSFSTFLTRFDDSGRADPPVRAVNPPGLVLYDIAWNGHTFVVSASDYYGTHAYILELNDDGSIAHDPVAIGVSPEPAPRLIANGHRVLALLSHSVAFVDSDDQLSPLPDVSPLNLVAPVPDDNGFTIYATVSAPATFPTGPTKLFRIRIGNDGSLVTQSLGDIDSLALVAAATNGATELVAWSFYVLGSGSNNFGLNYMLLTTDGQLVHGPAGIETGTAPPGEASGLGRPAAGWDGHQFAIAYRHSQRGLSDLRLVRVGTDGVPSGAAQTIDTWTATPLIDYVSPILGATPSRQFLFWGGRRNNDDLFSVRVRSSPDFDTMAGAPTSVLSQLRSQHAAPAMAADGEGVGIAWREVASTTRIAAQVVSRKGTVFDPIQLTDSARSVSAPAVAGGGGVYLVVWIEDEGTVTPPAVDHYHVLARRVSTDGALLDSQPLELQDGWFSQQKYGNGEIYRPAVAWNGAHFVAAWTGGDNRGYAMRVSSAGQLLDFSPFPFEPDNPFGDLGIDLQRTGDEISATFYARATTASFEQMAVRTVRIQQSGTLTKPVTLVPAGPRSFDIHSPVATAWNGHELLIGWLQLATTVTPTCVVGRTFALNGAPTGPQKSLICDISPDIANHGEIHLQPNQNGWSILYGGSGTLPPSILKVDTHLDRIGDPIVVSPSGSGIGAFLSLDNRLLVAYPRMEDAAAYAPRLFLQTLFLQARVHAVRRP